MVVQRAPFGSWTSGLAAEQLATANVRFGQIAIAGGTIFASEGRPAEGGRNVVVECHANGDCRDLNPTPFDARTRVHEYGGGAFVVAGDGELFFSHDRDQRIYRLPNLPDNMQPVKPVTYSVTKSALIGLTRYLATYWAARGVRVNAICPGGVGNGQPEEFVARLTNLIPMGRMARVDEYQGAILFLCSDASSYMTGAVLSVDGGRTAW